MIKQLQFMKTIEVEEGHIFQKMQFPFMGEDVMS